MPTITAPAPAAPTPVRKAAPYENWRPPIIGVSLLVPVGAGALVVGLLGCTMLPTGTVYGGQSLEQATQNVLHGAPGGLPLVRRVVLAWVQMRRRKVITHVLATESMPRKDVEQLTYRDPRAEVRVLPTLQVIDKLTPKGRLRALVGLQALATGETAYIEGDVVRTTGAHAEMTS
ncbi:hypothetical protein [Streptomyces sp. NPDC053560]|uniref:hypothetical protein n=1 Tax=Streptomyces sp. NPDC053560 TaxID=3365711 RepID=UPI0037D9781F